MFPAGSQGLSKVSIWPLMVSLSNYEQLEPASFDKLKMGRICAHQLLWKGPGESPRITLVGMGGKAILALPERVRGPELLPSSPSLVPTIAGEGARLITPLGAIWISPTGQVRSALDTRATRQTAKRSSHSGKPRDSTSRAGESFGRRFRCEYGIATAQAPRNDNPLNLNSYQSRRRLTPLVAP